MDRAALRRQMTEVVHAAHNALHDPTQMARLWGQANELCDFLEEQDLDAEQYGETEMVIALREDIRTGARPVSELVEEILWFVRAVEHVLQDEERDEIVDAVVRCDQFDG